MASMYAQSSQMFKHGNYVYLGPAYLPLNVVENQTTVGRLCRLELSECDGAFMAHWCQHCNKAILPFSLSSGSSTQQFSLWFWTKNFKTIIIIIITINNQNFKKTVKTFVKPLRYLATKNGFHVCSLLCHHKCSNMEIMAKISRKESNSFCTLTKAYKVLILDKKFQNYCISCLCAVLILLAFFFTLGNM